MSIYVSIGLFILGFILGGAVIWFLRQREMDSVQANQEQLETRLKDVFGNLSREALDRNQASFIELAKSRFEDLAKMSDKQLGQKKELIDESLKAMKQQLESLTRQTTELKGQMENSQKGITKLEDTTAQLRQILSSSQARGRWGERLVEDILNFLGLSEGINYKKQSAPGETRARPDYTFFLPQNRYINMDVKFPLDHYERYLTEETDDAKEAEKKKFLKDVRNHVKAIAGRDYIDPDQGSVDYVLMFIPNESIYTFLNQEDTDLIDYSLSQRIILCSPITLYAVLSLIRQSVQNFAMEQRAGEMQSLVGKFKDQWQRFVDKLDALGKSLNTVQNHYDELSGTRVRQLEKPMEKILDLNLEKPENVQRLEDE